MYENSTSPSGHPRWRIPGRAELPAQNMAPTVDNGCRMQELGMRRGGMHDA